MSDDDFNLESILSSSIPCKRLRCSNKFDLTRNNKEYCSEQCRKQDERERYFTKRKNFLQENMPVKNKFPELPTWNKLKLSDDLCRVLRGIYFLLLSNEIVYIGMSTHVIYRVAQHAGNHPSSFDTVFYLPVDGEGIKELESRMIEKYQPKYNILVWPEE